MHEKPRQNRVYVEIFPSCFLIISMENDKQYYTDMKIINIHYLDVSISAWISHGMPLSLYPGRGHFHNWLKKSIVSDNHSIARNISV